MRLVVLVLAAAAWAAAQEAGVRFVRVFSGLPNATDIQNARDGSRRLFLALQAGTIWILHDGRVNGVPLLDLGAKTRSNGECGLLGFAFPPGFVAKQYFYVNYTDPQCRNTIVSRYRMRDANTADPASETIIIREPQPYQNHNGGQLAFGPDGYLYIGFGDGGSAGDPHGYGQNNRERLGKIVRIDTESGASTYRVPATNPFIGNDSYLPEIWATGLRNPWRFTFDRLTGDLWIGDVGQNRAEEIDFQPASSRGGENYGWNIMEGLRCFTTPACNQAGLTLPVHEYTREQGDKSVTGGRVVRGRGAGLLRGVYVYGDYVSGRVWGIRQEGERFVNSLIADTTYNISTFGEDEDGEVYLADHSGGSLYRIEAPDRPRLTPESVVSSASEEAGLVSGSLTTAFASNITSGPLIQQVSPPLPIELAGVRVTVDGRNAVIAGIANVNGREQVNFLAPALNDDFSTVVVTRNGVASDPARVRVLTAMPGIFLYNGAAIVVAFSGNQLITAARPLLRGEVATIWATGLGPVDNLPAFGTAASAQPLSRVIGEVRVTIGGEPCDVSFAGLAPTLAGVFVINFTASPRIPQGNQDLVITSNGRPSRPAKVAVQ
jgi:uncharacterized protein (TIGR03437 family)